MPGRPSALSGVERTLVLGMYLVAAYALNVWLVGSWIPSGGDQGLWFLSVVAFFSFSLLSAPFFTRPDDVIAAALGSGLLLWSTAIPSVVGQGELEGFRLLGLAYSVLALAASGVASFSRRRPPERNPGIASATFRVSTTMGAPGALFTFPALLGALGFSQAEPTKLGVQVAVWILIVTIRPIEVVVEVIKLLREGSGSSGGVSVVGQISRVDSPNIVRLRISDRTAWESSPVLATTLADGGRHWLLPLFSQVQGGNIVGTGLCCKHSPSPTRLPAEGYVYQQDSPPDRGELIKALTGVDIEAELIGFVVEDSSIGRIRFEVAGGQTLQQGNLVFCGQGEAAVFYQILDARTAEETFEANPRGTHIVLAGQLGTPLTDRGFVRFGWVPEMNAPVFLAKERALPSDQTEVTGGFQVGVVPGSDIPVMGSMEGMQEHHTAILGMTGTGKTELALDIVRQAIEVGQKVICVDFTGEYRSRLADLDPVLVGLDPTPEEDSQGLTATGVEAIEVGQFKSEAEKRALSSLLDTVRPKVQVQVEEFLNARAGVGRGCWPMGLETVQRRSGDLEGRARWFYTDVLSQLIGRLQEFVPSSRLIPSSPATFPCTSMIRCAFLSSFSSRAFRRSSLRTFSSSGFRSGLRPRFFDRAFSDPLCAALRHVVRCDGGPLLWLCFFDDRAFRHSQHSGDPPGYRALSVYRVSPGHGNTDRPGECYWYWRKLTP